MKVSKILDMSNMRILFSLAEKEMRYIELSKLIRSRGALGISLKELESEGLIGRRVVISRPIQWSYSLSKKGKRLASKLEEARQILQESN